MSKTSQLPSPASHPLHHAWVSANAGAGKTTLLVERVLRLLLSGARPGGIMCLTYTKAAAAEMAERIYKKLGEWAVASEPELIHSLTATQGEPPTQLMLNRARVLLATVLDEPDGLRIQTIHSFCQSILQRFPLEAGMPPHFTVMDERTTEELMREAGLRLLNTETHERMEQIKEATQFLASRYSDHGFQSVLRLIAGNNRKLRELSLQSPDAIKQRIAAALGVDPAGSEESIIAAHFRYDEHTAAELKRAASQLHTCKTKKGQLVGEQLTVWQNANNYLPVWPAYREAFLTKTDCELRKDPVGKSDLSDPYLYEIIAQEQARVAACHQALQTFSTYRSSAHLVELAAQLLALYAQLKVQHALLDYDDLIMQAHALLRQQGNALWVLYKLDGGIDHLLVDEAQDTSREQWDIVQALTEEFFSGQGINTSTRTLFVVGDEKQSIFSFQGAQPKEFLRMRDYFEKRASDVGSPFISQSLLKSYRSTDPVLKAVDIIFAAPQMREAVLAIREEIQHLPNRSLHAGRVEIWPLQPQPEKPQPPAWELPLSPRYSTHAPQQLADTIARTIKDWLDHGEVLESTGQPIRPGDILILLQRRDTIASSLMRALKRLHIPVLGSSNAPLPENLAVMDLLSLAQFLLLPEDDLNFAALLKSPLLGFSEDDLFTLSQRAPDQTLWSRLQTMQQHSPVFTSAHDMLTNLLNRADFMPPYELFSLVLDVMGGRARIIGRMGSEYQEPIREFLDEALAYEQTHTPSLQGFVQWLLRSQSQKRSNLESSGNYVRLMTTHGAKGLEAPIVFLADTNRVKSKSNRVADILWYPAPEGGLLPLWPRSPSKSDPISRALHQARVGEEYAEYLRLYYVALTRPRDRLYICGWENNKQNSERSWYDIALQSLQPHMQLCDTPLGEGLRMESTQQEAIKPQAESCAAQAAPVAPVWLHSPAPEEPEPTRPLTPSHLGEMEPPAQSPSGNEMLMRRGVLIHRLLQYLPDVAPDQRQQAASHFLAHHGSMLPQADRDAMLGETLAIVNSPEYAAYFSQGSLAEAPLSGIIQLAGRPYTISGQVDRLSVTASEVWVIDYKTSRQPPANAAQTPAAYIRQMAAYRTLLQAIYPAHRIHCALLWTAAPKLVVLPEQLLNSYALNLDAA